MQAAGGNFAADDDFGPAEKISLEIHEAHVTGLMKLMGRFEFFGQHLALRRPKPPHHPRPLLRPGRAEVDFYDVGKLAKRHARIVGCEVIEGDEIASRLQAAMTRSSGSTVSRISATVWLGGSSVIRSLNRTSRVQFRNARRLSQSVLIPYSRELSSVERAESSGSVL